MCTGHSLHKVKGCTDLVVKTALVQLKQQDITYINITCGQVTQSTSTDPTTTGKNVKLIKIIVGWFRDRSTLRLLVKIVVVF
jgi:hypothetical protein